MNLLSRSPKNIKEMPKSTNLGVFLITVFSCLLITFSSFAARPEALEIFMREHYGNDGSLLLSAWFRLIDDNNAQPSRQKMEASNYFFNRHIQFTDDILLWKVADYWATPGETMGMRGGDCEDFAIAKYMSLIELGVAPEKLRLIYVKASIQRGLESYSQAHMVVGYYPTPNAIPLIMDNLDKNIKSADQRTDLKPVYSFNREGLWVGSIAESQADPTSRLSPWRDVLQRMKAEGF